MFGDTKVETLSKQTESIKLSEIMKMTINKQYPTKRKIIYTGRS